VPALYAAELSQVRKIAHYAASPGHYAPRYLRKIGDLALFIFTKRLRSN
jgi:hypothetical protein